MREELKELIVKISPKLDSKWSSHFSESIPSMQGSRFVSKIVFLQNIDLFAQGFPMGGNLPKKFWFFFPILETQNLALSARAGELRLHFLCCELNCRTPSI